MTKPRAVLFCPGRGSYGRDELGAIARNLRPGLLWEVLEHADETRSRAGQPTITDLDRADRFRPGVHLDGANAAELIWFATLASAQRLRERYEVLAVAGNSLGWYTALAVVGSLSQRDGWRLVTTMAALQKLADGGQLLTTTVDDDWRIDSALSGAVDVALAETNEHGPEFFAARSIRLGGHEVLAGTEPGIRHLLEILPEVELGGRGFPFRLAGHGPFHTPLCAAVAEAASVELAELVFRQPDVHLIDGRGDIHTPWSSDPAQLARYTTDVQVQTTFDFSAAVRTAIREFCPDVLLCCGPGTTLRAPIGHVVLRDGYAGIATREQLFDSNLIRVDGE